MTTHQYQHSRPPEDPLYYNSAGYQILPGPGRNETGDFTSSQTSFRSNHASGNYTSSSRETGSRNGSESPTLWTGSLPSARVPISEFSAAAGDFRAHSTSGSTSRDTDAYSRTSYEPRRTGSSNRDHAIYNPLANSNLRNEERLVPNRQDSPPPPRTPTPPHRFERRESRQNFQPETPASKTSRLKRTATEASNTYDLTPKRRRSMEHFVSIPEDERNIWLAGLLLSQRPSEVPASHLDNFRTSAFIDAWEYNVVPTILKGTLLSYNTNLYKGSRNEMPKAITDDILCSPDKYGLPTSVRDRIRQEGKLKETLRAKVSSLLSDKRHNMKTYLSLAIANRWEVKTMARGLAGMVNPRMQVQDQHLYRWAYLRHVLANTSEIARELDMDHKNNEYWNLVDTHLDHLHKQGREEYNLALKEIYQDGLEAYTETLDP